ncbi:MAG: thioredoxin domain-containing protein, partial [Anaerolineales bacterium]|nr:thioredoxin domain-containing protein [Anaerolineales bacterium]
LFLLRYHQRTGDKISLQMVEHTLQQMRLGGIFDHVGFGFHRYATDEYWLLPHFEKMLYDQAMLTIAYAEAYQITGNSFYEKTAREIITYVLRDMTDAKGGFYSAEDADSEGEEGKFYVWTAQEIAEILGKTDAELFNRVYGIEPEGNFMEEATGHRTGANIPHLRQPLEKLAAGLNTTADSLAANLENMRQKLFAEREKRVHPLKDDKILTDWNG